MNVFSQFDFHALALFLNYTNENRIIFIRFISDAFIFYRISEREREKREGDRSLTKMAALWQDARLWLVEARVLPPDSPLLQTSATLLDLAAVLQNGVVLCDLLNRFNPGCVPGIHRTPSHQVRYTNISLHHFVLPPPSVFLFPPLSLPL